MPYTSEKPKKVGSYTKPKKPKDLPKAPVSRLSASDMFNPNFAKPLPIASQIVPRTGTTVGPGGQPATGTPGSLGGPVAPSALGGTTTTPEGIVQQNSVTGPGGTATAGSMPNGYSPAGYGPAFYQNPDALAADVLAGMGITNPEMIDVFTDLAGVGTALDMIMNMSQGTTVSPVSDTAAYIDAMMQGQLTPGGAAIDPNALIEMIMNADISSPLGGYMASGGPDAVNALIQAALVAGGGNPYAQRGVMNMMQTQAQDYNRGLARIDPATADPYYQGLRNGPLGRYLG